MGVGLPDVREGLVENRVKAGKMFNFPGVFEGRFLPLSLNVKNTPQTDLEIEPEN